MREAHKLPQGKSSLPLPWGSSGELQKGHQGTFQDSILKIQIAPQQTTNQPALLVPMLTLQPCSMEGSNHLGTTLSCFTPATAENKGSHGRKQGHGHVQDFAGRSDREAGLITATCICRFSGQLSRLGEPGFPLLAQTGTHPVSSVFPKGTAGTTCDHSFLPSFGHAPHHKIS